MANAWHCVRIKPQQEMLAARGLREQGFAVYLPKKFERAVIGKRAHAVCSLRFENYLFIQFDTRLETHGPINNTRGVASSLGSPGLLCDPDGKPDAVRDRVIATLRILEDEEHSSASRPASKDTGRTDLQIGDKVRIDDNVDMWGGYEGQLLDLHRGLAKVLLGSVAKVFTDDLISLVELGKPKSNAKKNRK